MNMDKTIDTEHLKSLLERVTPGEWETDCKDHDEPFQDIKINGPSRNICKVWIDDAPVNDYNDEQNANAELMAMSKTLARRVIAAEKLAEAARGLTEGLQSDFRARNGRMTGIQADDGEKCYIAHSDQVFELNQALSEWDKSQ